MDMDGQSRFAILRHDHPFLHWDLLLESGSSARTWRLLRTPVCEEPLAAEALADHRLMYLDYAGPVSHGRGRVERFAGGHFRQCPDDSGFPFRSPGWLQNAICGLQQGAFQVLLQLEFFECEQIQWATLLQLTDGRLFWWFTEPKEFSGLP